MTVFSLVFGEWVTSIFSLVFIFLGWTLLARVSAGFTEAELAVTLGPEGGMEGGNLGESFGGPGPDGFGQPPSMLS